MNHQAGILIMGMQDNLCFQYKLTKLNLSLRFAKS